MKHPGYIGSDQRRPHGKAWQRLSVGPVGGEVEVLVQLSQAAAGEVAHLDVLEVMPATGSRPPQRASSASTSARAGIAGAAPTRCTHSAAAAAA
jgi:hypothetical protein